ncbi:MAG: mechanosensitive ion channel family protein [Planctomycetes bacterium]|nr:mechanosensitive ion channel family protein [Planctomycetota bacterium]
MFLAVETLWFGSAVLLVVAIISWLFFRFAVVPGVRAITARSSAWWDDVLADKFLLARLAWVVPLVVLHYGIGLVPDLPDHLDLVVRRLVEVLLVVAIVGAIGALCAAINRAYLTAQPEVSRSRPIKGYLQVVHLLAVMVGLIFVLATMLDRSPLALITGLGAATAILMLVFRDTILSFVAGVQLTVNRLVHVGDWIEMPQFGADGDVIDISLNVVQVQNWDKTITAIPAHRFLEHSFKNWRGMTESGGRRIARAVDIDLTSIRFLDEPLVEQLRGLQFLRPYLDERSREISTWNQENGFDTNVPGNGRQMTNVGCFRAYVAAYLHAHPRIRQDMTFLIRQMPPGPTGLPIQVYVFTATTAWAEYEAIQSDIFDHLYAVLPLFDLRPFQHPTGNDMRQFAHAATAAAT